MLLVLRHGTTDDNADGRVRASGTGLNDQGRHAAAIAAEASQGLPLKAIITSPLRRARETASIWSQRTGAPVQVDRNVRARDMGALEGKPIAHVKGLLDTLARKPEMAPPGKGEAVQPFRRRYESTTKGKVEAPELYGLVGHGSGVKALEMAHGQKPSSEWAKEPSIAPGQFALVTKEGVVPLAHEGLTRSATDAGVQSS